MSKKINIVISDSDLDFSIGLSNFLSAQSDIEIVGRVDNGLDACSLIKNIEPDIVILDVIMPHLDGIGVLEKLKSERLEKRPIFIMLSSVKQENIIEKALNVGADYYMMKPFNMETLLIRIRQLQEDKNEINKDMIISEEYSRNRNYIYNNKDIILKVEVTNLLHKIGIPPHIQGFHYLREGIIMVINNMDMLSSVTKELYPDIAKKHNTTACKVERSIRHAIQSTWDREKTATMEKIFHHRVNDLNSKPTNAEFIAYLADKLSLELQVG